jgi:hypothetical protein
MRYRTEPDQINSSDNTIDLRDVRMRAEYLEGLETEAKDALTAREDEISSLSARQGLLTADELERLASLEDEATNDWKGQDGTEYGYTDDWTSDTYDELRLLQKLEADISGEGTLIHEDYFETHAQQIAEELGYIKREAQWPYTHIDWEAAARDLQHDYTVIEWDGVTFYTRDC